jgi:hypothetical protein
VSEHLFMPIGVVVGAVLGAVVAWLVFPAPTSLDWANAVGMGGFLGVSAGGFFYLRRGHRP